ncbi:hypothetical protein DVH24_009350 [Malus domestica]|uniref:Uncharacterized protein n=1 Tax=Malus domestica TaxID=3750 RepID=A0A498IQQ7_MALDO|nr:hypothetical protein DVH24_009350 [Malus domestica]
MGVRLADIHLSQTLRKTGALCTGYDLLNGKNGGEKLRKIDIARIRRTSMVASGLGNEVSSLGFWVMIPLLHIYFVNNICMIALLIMHSTTLLCVYYCMKLLAALMCCDNNGI